MDASNTAKSKRETKMKIEIDAINGMVVVSEFSADTEIVKGSLKLKDFLKDELDTCLGFEVTEEEAQEILGMNYGIKGFTGK